MFNVRFSGGEEFVVAFASPENFGAEMTTTIEKPIVDPYEGPYEFTPGEEDQTIQIDGLTATENIVVKAVPENYGRLTYSGGILRVW